MKKITLLVTVIILTGCSGLNDDFACNATASGSCTTVEQANNKARLGSVNDYSSKNGYVIVNKDEKKLEKNDEQFSNIELLAFNIPKRTEEIIHRIWIAPYVDDKDNFHKEQIIYISTQPPVWEVSE